MDKNAIKKYAVWARRELIERVSQKALQYEITADGKPDPNADKVNGRPLSDAEKKQRQALIRKVNKQGYEQSMEEAAYTWFNRFAALRFMEVNGYLPSHVRVFTNDEGEFKPQILSEAIHLDLDGLNIDKVYELKSSNREEELFKYLLIVQCNALSAILPQMFQRIEDYTELLFPDYLLREGSVIHKMISMIPEEDWRDQVQIIGWLYQYYTAEPKDKVFADLKKNIKITRGNIPAATQLFTPDWIVRYMVENSLGRLWIEGHPNDELKANWKYYLDEAEQEPSVQAKLEEVRKEHAALTPEDIKCIDPCMGSGHILCYLFDVLIQIYESQGYSQRDAAQSIVRHNLYGLDIDKRATQLAYFSVMMKARQYDRRFFSRNLQPMVYSTTGDEDGENFGSLVMVDDPGERPEEPQSIFEWADYEKRLNAWSYRYLLVQKYHVVVTNPPYMGSSGMNVKLGEFIKKNYPDSKSDASTAFMERTLQLCRPDGLMAMINIPVWMFLSSYEKLRQKMLSQNTISSMVHPGRGIFGSNFGTTTFVIAKQHIKSYVGTYRRLFDKQGEVSSIEEREQAFLSGKGAFTAQQDNFSKIPGSPVAYWVSAAMLRAFEGIKVADVADTCMGMTTGDNERFLRLWHESAKEKIKFDTKSVVEAMASGAKWFPYHKGGEFRRWYGNNDYIVNWEKDGAVLRSFAGSTIRNAPFYYREAITWSLITSSIISFRYRPIGFIFGDAGPAVFPKNVDFTVLFGLLNTKIIQEASAIINPTINSSSGVVANFPYIKNIQNKNPIKSCVKNNVAISKADWDSFETSWDFKKHPMV